MELPLSPQGVFFSGMVMSGPGSGPNLDGVGVSAACNRLPVVMCGAGAGTDSGRHCQYLCMQLSHPYACEY